jgi:hypothetical protein
MNPFTKKEFPYHFVAEVLNDKGIITNSIDGIFQGKIETFQDYKKFKDTLRERFHLGVNAPIIIQTLHKL